MKATFGSQSEWVQSAWEKVSGWPIFCGGCGHKMGVLSLVGLPDDPVNHHSELFELVRLTPDAADGLPRFGLRPGTFRKGRDPIRRPLKVAALPSGADASDPAESIGMTDARKYHAYCGGCGADNLVDIAAVPVLL
jgi:hypothetical protein